MTDRSAQPSSLDGKRPYAEGDLSSLDAKRPYAEGKMSSLDVKRPSAEGKVSSLDGKTPYAEGDLSSLDVKRPSARGEAADFDVGEGQLQIVQHVLPRVKGIFRRQTRSSRREDDPFGRRGNTPVDLLSQSRASPAQTGVSVPHASCRSCTDVATWETWCGADTLVRVLQWLARRNQTSVDDVLTRELEDVACAYAEEIASDVAGFEMAMSWPECAASAAAREG